MPKKYLVNGHYDTVTLSRIRWMMLYYPANVDDIQNFNHKCMAVNVNVWLISTLSG